MKKLYLLLVILFSCSLRMHAQEATNIREKIPLGANNLCMGCSKNGLAFIMMQ